MHDVLEVRVGFQNGIGAVLCQQFLAFALFHMRTDSSLVPTSIFASCRTAILTLRRRWLMVVKSRLRGSESDIRNIFDWDRLPEFLLRELLMTLFI